VDPYLSGSEGEHTGIPESVYPSGICYCRSYGQVDEGDDENLLDILSLLGDITPRITYYLNDRHGWLFSRFAGEYKEMNAIILLLPLLLLVTPAIAHGQQATITAPQGTTPKVSLHLSMIVLLLAGLAVGPTFSYATNEGSYMYGYWQGSLTGRIT
jgi:hypothetical protein